MSKSEDGWGAAEETLPPPFDHLKNCTFDVLEVKLFSATEVYNVIVFLPLGLNPNFGTSVYDLGEGAYSTLATTTKKC